jgi:hypothetical protein
MENRLNDERWHTVNIERNIVEVMVVVNRMQIKNVERQK